LSTLSIVARSSGLFWPEEHLAPDRRQEFPRVVGMVACQIDLSLEYFLAYCSRSRGLGSVTSLEEKA
jgi:hypothetical protein